MAVIFSALVSAFAVIALGALMDRRGWVSREMWQGLERIAYYVLFPALIVSSLGHADLSEAPVRELVAVFVTAMAAMAGLVFALRPLLIGPMGMTGPQFSSVFQGAIRWHTFIGIAIIAAAYGPEGVALAAIAMATIIPIANISSVVVVTAHSGNGMPGPGRFVRIIATNPFILGSLGGTLINALGIPLVSPVSDTLDLLGKAATGIGLLVVGAGLRFDAGERAWAGAALATALKLLVMPALVWLGAWLYGVDGLALTVAMIAAAVPTATGSFILARQLGGDAELMAGILTAQVIAATVTLPAVLWLATG
jgi:hypothetical protein